MSKILKSSAIALAAIAAVSGATYSYFSDTETSTGNTFTAGAIDLKIDSEQHYNNMVCANVNGFGSTYVWIPENANPATFTQAQATTFNTNNPANYPLAGTACNGTWVLTDLVNGVHKFFDFGDVKPGDSGEDTISLHIDNNPAWACVDVNVTKNDDVSSTEPELEVDVPEDNGNPFDGELAQNVFFTAWLDQGNTPGFQGKGQDTGEGDNFWQGQEKEPLFFSNVNGPASDVLGGKTYALADSTTPGAVPIPGAQTDFIGLAWCAGKQTVNVGAGTITCDGSTLGNNVQTDMFQADITFRVEQARNNPNFRCARGEETAPTTTLTLAKAVIPPAAALDTAFTLGANGPTTISGVEGQASVTNASVTPGLYNLSESGGPQNALSRHWECSGNVTPEIDNANGTGSVTIAAGEHVVCGITNTYQQ